MKVLILVAIIVIANADVSHILQEDGYHYTIPNKPFPVPIVDIPAPVQQTYLPPPQKIVPPKVIVPAVPIRPVTPIISVPPLIPIKPALPIIQKPSNIQPQYLPPAPIIRPIQPIIVTSPRPQPSIAPLTISSPQPAITFVNPTLEATISQPLVVPRPVVPVKEYLPPASILNNKQTPIVYKPTPAVVRPIVQPIIPVASSVVTPVVLEPAVNRPEIITKPVIQIDNSESQLVNVEHKGYFYDNNPHPPFSF